MMKSVENILAERLNECLDKMELPERGRPALLQQFFADQGVEISTQSTYKWLRGDKKPDSDNLVLLARFANTTCDYLLGADAIAIRESSESRDQSNDTRLRLISLIQSPSLDHRALLAIEALALHLSTS